MKPLHFIISRAIVVRFQPAYGRRQESRLWKSTLYTPLPGSSDSSIRHSGLHLQGCLPASSFTNACLFTKKSWRWPRYKLDEWGWCLVRNKRTVGTHQIQSNHKTAKNDSTRTPKLLHFPLFGFCSLFVELNQVQLVEFQHLRNTMHRKSKEKRLWDSVLFLNALSPPLGFLEYSFKPAKYTTPKCRFCLYR